MIFKSALTYALLVTLSFASVAGWIDREGNPLPDSPDQKAIGEFGAWLLLTNNVEKALKNWGTPSETVYLDTEKNYKRNEFISALIIFSGCTEDKNGHCNLAVKYKIIQPDGKIYADLPIQEAWIGKASPGKALQMSIGYVKVRIEDHEAIGTYEILADVIDSNLDEKISLSSKFEILE